MQPGWCQPVRQEFMENECEALPGVAYPGVRDNRSTINTKTGYDDDDDVIFYQKNTVCTIPLSNTKHQQSCDFMFHFMLAYNKATQYPCIGICTRARLSSWRALCQM